MKGKTYKLLSLILVFMLVTPFLSVYSKNVEPNGVNGIFPDIKGHWAYDSIEKFRLKGWVKGYNDDYFRPDKLISRAEFTAMVVRILNSINADAKSTYPDIKPGQWFYKEVCSASEKGYIKGFPDGFFKPFLEMSRQEVAVFSQRLLKVPMFEGKSSVVFSDEKSFPEWSRESIKILASHEIIHGYPDKTFKPEKLVTRAEAVKMLDIILKKLEILEESTKEPVPGAVDLPESTPTPTIKPTSTPTMTASSTPSPVHTATWTPTPTIAVVAVPPVNNNPVPVSTPTPTATHTNTPIPTPTPTDTPTPTSTPIIDLIPSGVNTQDVSWDAQNLTVSGTVLVDVINQGLNDLMDSFKVIIFEDTDHNNVFSREDRVLGEKTYSGGLKSQEGTNVDINVEGTVDFSENLLHVWVDSGREIGETDENNNTMHNRIGCQDKPPVGKFNPVLEWKWTGSQVLPASLNIMMTPVIMDLNADGVSDIVFGSTSSSGGANVEVGELRALSGDGNGEIFTVTDENLKINTASSIAAGDIDGDKKPEIIACDTSGKRLIAFGNDGSFKWRSPDLENIYWGAPSLADLDGNGTVEIIMGRHVLDHNGNILWTGSAGSGYSSVGAITFAADIDTDGSLEVICGNTVYKKNGEILWQNTSVLDGFNAAGNFDGDGFAELVLVHGGSVWLLEHDGTVKWGPVSIPGGGFGGPPTVADFDSDGKVEIGVAGASRYTVFDTDGAVLWSVQTQDASSNVTGSSVFDFEGDGAFEVVYRDELYLRIYSGKDGTELFKVPMSSCTWYEYPVIADVDNDGNAEIVAVANLNCGKGPQQGVFVYGDENDTWVNTRKVWNQHAYSITHVNEDGTINANPQNNWDVYNNFRCNQSLNALQCVDLTASCLRAGTQEVEVRIGNGGALHVAKGVKVSFYNSQPDQVRKLLGTVRTLEPLKPGEYQDIKLLLQNPLEGEHNIYAVVDDDGKGHGSVREINETNNIVGKTFTFESQSTPTPTGTPMPTLIPAETPQPTSTPILKDISAQEAYEMYKNPEQTKVHFIDVRGAEEYNAGHIPGAVNIAYNSEGFNNALDKLDRTSKYIVYCGSGFRSSLSVKVMTDMNFTELYNMQGGAAQWAALGYPLEPASPVR
ncbi:MAG: S-layer homology domain-containing protein [Clostridia bacterium]|nr:S-layer homology domain-containing protein [Clostridia bacterium]